MDDQTTTENRKLVEALMLRGWYREGQVKVDVDGREVWRFRSGHNLEDPLRKTVLVRARSEQAAMQALLARLEQGEADPDLAAK
jgi:hypothetical protein